MKRILAFIMCAFVLMCTMSLTIFAEGTVEPVATETPATETPTETETPMDTNAPETAIPEVVAPETNTPETEGPGEEVIAPENDTNEDAPNNALPTTEQIVKWIQENLEEISVVVTLIGTVIIQVRKHAALNKSVATLNNNSITVAENSNAAINTALTEVAGVSLIVKNYKEELDSLLSEVRKSAEEKQRLEVALTEVENYLKTAKLANIELADEVAELLVLANIPNSKKDELYSRHRAAVEAIASAEVTEEKEDDGKEA